MLKLIDGTELTSEMKEAFKRRVTHAYIKLDDGTILSSSNHLKSVKLENLRYNEETNNIIGEATSKRVTLGLFNKDNTLNLENKEFELVIGTKLVDGTNVEISYGKFIVQKPENNDTKQSTDFEAFDYMCKTNQKYVPGVTFPCTFGDLAEDVCNQCGLELGNKNFRNSNKTIEVNPFINNEQCRFVIKQIAKIAFSWARVNIDNKLYFDFANKSNNESVEIFSLDNYIDLEKNDETIPINTIVLKNSNIDTENVTIRNQALITAYGKEKRLIVSEDYFAYNQEIRQDLIVAAEELYGLVYSPVHIKSIGTIYLDSDDLIEIKDKKNNSIYTYCFNHIIDYKGTLFDEIESPAMTETEIEYENEPDEKLNQRITEISVKKHEQKIESLIKQVGDRTDKETSITQDIDSIDLKIRNVIDITREIAGIKTITLENSMAGYLYELHIFGNNTVFDYLTPSDDLVPSDDLIPYGDSRLKITRQTIDDNGEITEETSEIIDIGIKDVLRQKEDVYDEFSLVNNKAKIIRRIGALDDGTTYILETPVIEELGDLQIATPKGNMTIEILNYSANLSAKWIIINDYTKVFATTTELEASIKLLANQINLIVKQTVKDNEIIAKLNLAVKNGQGIIEMFGNVIKIVSDNFSLDENGVMRAVAGYIANWVIEQNQLSSEGESIFIPSVHDVNIVTSYLRGNLELNDLQRYLYDFNEDGKIDIQDAIAMSRVINGLEVSTKKIKGLIKLISNDINNTIQLINTDSGMKSIFGIAGISSPRAILQTCATDLLDLGAGFINLSVGENFKKIRPVGSETPEHTYTLDTINYGERNALKCFVDGIFYGTFMSVLDNHKNVQTPVSDGNVNIITSKGTYLEVQTGTDTYIIQYSTSDKNLKENIKETEILNAIEILKKIKHYSFDWIKTKEHIEIGYIANEMYETNPILATRVKQNDGSYIYQYNEKSILSLCTKAIQEQQKQIDFLAKKLNCEKELEDYMKGEN